MIHRERHQPNKEAMEVIPRIQLPDMPPIDAKTEPSTWQRKEMVEQAILFKGTEFLARVSLTRNLENNGSGIIGGLQLELIHPENKERASSFQAALKHGGHSDIFTKDYAPHTHWSIYYRSTDKEMRRQGFGSFNLSLFEQLMAQAEQSFGDVQADWIDIRTSLGSLSNMIVDREWLEEYITNPTRNIDNQRFQHLSEKIGSKTGMGYIPYPEHVDRALQILDSTSEEAGDSAIEPVAFIKPLRNLAMEELF